jgi:hypothetical protein
MVPMATNNAIISIGALGTNGGNSDPLAKWWYSNSDIGNPDNTSPLDGANGDHHWRHWRLGASMVPLDGIGIGVI